MHVPSLMRTVKFCFDFPETFFSVKSLNFGPMTTSIELHLRRLLFYGLDIISSSSKICQCFFSTISRTQNLDLLLLKVAD